MSTFTMDMMINSAARDKGLKMLSRGEWRNMVGCYDNRQEDGMSPLFNKVSVSFNVFV